MDEKHYKNERTFVLLKPDAIQRSLVGDIVQRFERVGLKLIASKFLVPTQKQIDKHYTIDKDWKKSVGAKAIESYLSQDMTPPSKDPLVIGNKVLDNLKKYMTSGPAFTSVWQGAHAVKIIRKIVGGTEPLSSDVGTIRGDYVLDSYQMADSDSRAVRNLVHASGTPEEAEKEIKIWFKNSELINYKLASEQITYDVNLDGIWIKI